MSDKEVYYGDLEKTKIIGELFSAENESRNQEWQQTFLSNVADASFKCNDPQVIAGPDGFPYFVLNMPESGKEFQCYVIKHMVPDFIMEHGLGIVFSPSKGQPDWVFTYGNLVNYYLKGEFYTESKNWFVQTEETVKEDIKILVGQPSEYIIPTQTRKILKQYLKQYTETEPKIVLTNRPEGEEFLQQLVFNLTPDDFQSEDHFKGVMQNIGWFLPRHYTYASTLESTFGENFQPL
ncbi:hypothetical protein [Dysgonomonas macrotermitis]|uniref:Uncharacterized protein n=1 Tax=Dysgonomonas macrotermitis TaxID=1346286 RepID=A0A1M5HV50_9BACT|nr:hypothetical protein [Dysgonomonas macrotermitis]SHG19856.1 hypothetical protein SAMN05444362_11751 [Dysgonomonas macrotermitis]